MSTSVQAKTTVLIRFVHGLGDAVQFTAVLRHIATHRPGWEVDMYSLRGKHSAFHGLCRRSYHDQEPEPADAYVQRFDLGWYENYNRYGDRPNSKVTNCLEEVFRIPYEPELGRYQVRVSEEARERAWEWLKEVASVSGEWREKDNPRLSRPSPLTLATRYRVVLFHYQGNTSQEKKNLRDEQVAPLVDLCLEAGYVPVILDWDGRSGLFDNKRVFNPGVHAGDLWGGFGSGDAEMIAALISLSTAFIGVDSGPGKCASATDTPSLICWTRMHPVQFHDPADNTVHLVPANHREIPPGQYPAIGDYFEKHYRLLTYRPGEEWALTETAARWLEGVMRGQGSGVRGQEGVGYRESGRRGERVVSATVPCNQLTDGGGRLAPTTHSPLTPDPCPLIFRYGFWIPEENPIQSWTIIDDVYVRDAYKTELRPRREGIEYVVDVGANIGAFAKLWHKRNPGARIACVEVNAKLLPALEANVGKFATVIPRACHYGSGLRLLDSVCATGLSIGGSRVVLEDEWQAENDPQYVKAEEPVATITLEEIQEQLGFPRIDILKLDCEGSEFSILEHADLSRVGTIFVESHGSKRWRELLAKRFEGWDIGHMSRSTCGEFENWHLVNPAWAEAGNNEHIVP